jgi:transposase
VKDPLIRDRLQAVQRYYECGSFRNAAKTCGCGHMKVKYWQDRYEAEGLRGLWSRIPPGWPWELDAKTEERIKENVLSVTDQVGWNIKQIREYIRTKGHVTYTERHTMRVAQRWGLARLKPRPQYAHSVRSERLAFLKEKQADTQA